MSSGVSGDGGMKILCLYNNDCALELFAWLEAQGHDVILCSDKLEADWCEKQGFDLAVSYTYRYILSSDILESLGNNVVNIHNSVLPWNRGADPNLWSIVDNTPRGVTLHYMDASLDKGYIIAQEIIPAPFDEKNETLSTTYNELDKAAKLLFKRAFEVYKFWPSLKKQCLGVGSYHSLHDGERIKKFIKSYDTSVNDFRLRLYPPSTKKSVVATLLRFYCSLPSFYVLFFQEQSKERHSGEEFAA